MGIFTRFADIVNSNLSALLDKAEDPEKMVRLIIQEMEDTLVEVRSTSAKILAEKKEAVRRVERATRQADEWQAKAELALSKDREDLARAALVEKQKAGELVEALKQELETIETQIARLKEEITQLQEKLNDARARQKTIVMRKQAASSRLDVKRQLDTSKIDQAMNRFEQYERRVENIESEVEAYELSQPRSLDDEFAALEAEDKVNQELEAMKKKMSKKKS
ncbi:phage shock protein PspA [Ferrimonas marina]|uniref:Phage shock protein A (PspA) family protein n=1 Tax=Ferrimonas marina TaxID=299255 RepID=A0A1M5Y8L2_9GAMM|nr:phage shock protein PspA [Ferrimonas marina]SHI08296.1 phage shock protein A (PspA) family protein [Ferrimonas marina]